MNAKHFDKLQPYCGDKTVQWHYLDTDKFVLSVNKNDIVRDLRSVNDIFDFINMNKNHELLSNKNKKERK